MINQINILSSVKARDWIKLNLKTLALNSPVEKKKGDNKKKWLAYTKVILPTECFPVKDLTIPSN